MSHRTNANTAQLDDKALGYSEECILSYIERPRTLTTCNDFFLLEASKVGTLYGHIFTLYHQGKLTTSIRRMASIGAKNYLMHICQNSIRDLPRTAQTEGLVRVVLIGYASKINVQGLTVPEFPVIFDSQQLTTACTHAGKTAMEIFDIFIQWHPTACSMSYLREFTPDISHHDRVSQAPIIYRTYKENPTDENAMLLALYLLPIDSMRICRITSTPPSIEQAQQALDRAHTYGAGYERAIRQYIVSVKKGS